MRKVWSKWLAVAVLAITVVATSPANAQRSVSLQVFYDELQPYGHWIDHGRHGYVWMPDAGRDFVPYGSNGYWVQTGYGNTWVSNYSWGWAPFHYGRWFYDDFYGWLWVPDTTWGPAWVTWRSGGGYYGWAPLMPGLAISTSMGYYNSIPDYYWNFVPYRYVMYRQVYRHCLPRPRVVNVINQTTVIVNNNYNNYDNDGSGRTRDRHNNDRADYFTGPSRSEIEKRSGERITQYDVHDSQAPGRTEVSRNSVSLYKPAVEQSTRSRALPAQFTRDNAQGREQLTEIRSRQLREQRSSESFDNNRSAIRGSERPTYDSRSAFERPTAPGDVQEGTRRDIDALRRDLHSNDRTERQPERTNTRRDALDRVNRDVDFNTLQRQREAEEQLRQQRDVQQREQLQRDDQSQRMRELREQSIREREQRFQELRQNQERQQQRMNRTIPAESNEPAIRRQPEQFQRSAPSREPSRQQYVPQQRQQQRQPNQQQMSSPGRSGSGQPVQRPASPGRTQSRVRQ